MAAVNANAEEVARKLAAAAMRAKDVTPAMVAASRVMDRLMRVAFRASAEPSGEKWATLEGSTREKRKRKGRGRGGLKALEGDTGQLKSTAFVTPLKDGLRFGSMAKSEGGYPYWLTHQFGTDRAGRGNNTRIPQRAFFPVEEVAGKLVPMEGGSASAFFERLRSTVLRYITKGKA